MQAHIFPGEHVKVTLLNTEKTRLFVCQADIAELETGLTDSPYLFSSKKYTLSLRGIKDIQIKERR